MYKTFFFHDSFLDLLYIVQHIRYLITLKYISITNNIAKTNFSNIVSIPKNNHNYHVVRSIILQYLSKLGAATIWVTQNELYRAQQMFVGILRRIHHIHRLFYKIPNS